MPLFPVMIRKQYPLGYPYSDLRLPKWDATILEGRFHIFKELYEGGELPCGKVLPEGRRERYFALATAFTFS